MLEYFKTILSKVSFDRKLFEKELKKAINSLVNDDLGDLKKWCYDKFGHMYSNVLHKQFLLAEI
jgi:lantibiotic modifying enzyme